MYIGSYFLLYLVFCTLTHTHTHLLHHALFLNTLSHFSSFSNPLQYILGGQITILQLLFFGFPLLHSSSPSQLCSCLPSLAFYALRKIDFAHLVFSFGRQLSCTATPAAASASSVWLRQISKLRSKISQLTTTFIQPTVPTRTPLQLLLRVYVSSFAINVVAFVAVAFLLPQL